MPIDAFVIEAHHGVLEVCRVVDRVPEEPEHVPRRYVVVVVNEKVEARRGALLGRPAQPHHALERVVEVGVEEVPLDNVFVLRGLFMDL